MKEDVMKVGIVTLHGYHNYGNRLQNYAVQEVVKKIGFNVETVVIDPMFFQKEENKTIYKRVNKVFKLGFVLAFKKFSIKIFNKINYAKNKELIKERTKKFKIFSNNNLMEKFWNLSQGGLNNLSDKYDFFITGSDQVWNPIYKEELPIYFLTFTEKNKRIAYAPSFGVSDIPNEYKENFKMWLEGIDKLSVREEAGAKIIKELTGRDSEVLIDPTLMLSKEEWLSVSKVSANKPKGKYILTYFLGGPTKEVEKKVKDIAEKNDFKIINLVDFKDKETYITGPSEFIDYINSASVFFTDSFHGVVFSILMETPFVIYERVSKSASMYSRIETLLDMFNLRAREAHNIKNNDEIFEMDFSHVTPILELERKKAINYLKDALDVKSL